MEHINLSQIQKWKNLYTTFKPSLFCIVTKLANIIEEFARIIEDFKSVRNVAGCYQVLEGWLKAMLQAVAMFSSKFTG